MLCLCYTIFYLVCIYFLLQNILSFELRKIYAPMSSPNLLKCLCVTYTSPVELSRRLRRRIFLGLWFSLLSLSCCRRWPALVIWRSRFYFVASLMSIHKYGQPYTHFCLSVRYTCMSVQAHCWPHRPIEATNRSAIVISWFPMVNTQIQIHTAT